QYMHPAPRTVRLRLAASANRLLARVQVCGLRDTRHLFGVRFLDAAGLSVRLPATADESRALVAGEMWLESVRATGRERLVASAPAPAGVTVRIGDMAVLWAAGTCEWPLPQPALRVEVSLDAARQSLARTLELPENRVWQTGAGTPVAEHRASILARIAGRATLDPSHGQIFGLLEVIARRAVGLPQNEDRNTIVAAMDFVRARNDCADMVLAMLLRLRALESLAPDEVAGLRDLVLGFRYWHDELGTDAMCFGSENHSLLFHGAQLLVGEWLPDAQFAASGRIGREQAQVAAERCRAWLDLVECVGFLEFNASGYLAITVAALLNVADFAADAALRCRAAAQVDAILRLLARHTFSNVVASPQGRVYRGVLTPESEEAQSMIAFAVPEAILAESGWLAFLATSPGYRPPEDLATLAKTPQSLRYRQGHADIVLEKTGGYLLTAVQIPTSFPDEAGWHAILPGIRGYQQHLWQATLAPGCHIFVTHPGETFDLGQARPGYWYGNGHLPTLLSRPGEVLAIHAAPGEHPVAFTHAHWPTDAFDETLRCGAWLFGAKAGGYVGLWCSTPLAPHDEVLTGREWRAPGRVVAWVCRAADRARAGSLVRFAEECQAREPRFDAAALTLSIPGAPPVTHVATTAHSVP
ncbi:MAG: hypothetical protein WCH98_03430, partial [Verrucomicrobiota bacterium]